MLLFFDIDGTLWNYRNEIREKTRFAIRKARANGHKCFINTGRARAYVTNRDLLDIGFDGIVSACGTMIEHNGSVVFNRLIPQSDAIRTIETVRSYYGMAEQTGCICMECACGHLHTSAWSDIIIRREKDYSVCGSGEPGVIQVLTPIALSYPGHSLLTEDRGVLLGEDDCPCGRRGKYFKVLGRLPRAEIRGCSDTFEGK